MGVLSAPATAADCVHKVPVCHIQPAAHGKPAHQVCTMQPRCKNTTSGVYDAPLVAGCLDFGPPTAAGASLVSEPGGALSSSSSRRSLLSDGGHGPTGLPYWADTTWISLDLTSAGPDTVTVDLSSLNGSTPLNRDRVCLGQRQGYLLQCWRRPGHLEWLHRVHTGQLPDPAAGRPGTVRRPARQSLHCENQGRQVRMLKTPGLRRGSAVRRQVWWG